MFTFRVTAKLATKLKAQLDPTPPASTGRLGDWYGNVLFLRPAHLVLCVSERSLLPVVLPAKDLPTLPQRLAAGVAAVLSAIGVDAAAAATELAAMQGHTFARTANRRVLGSMNDFAWMMAADGRSRTLLQMSLALAEAPCSPLGMKNPIDVTLALLGAAPRARGR